MKKILVPIDFSKNAFLAARYAAVLAGDRNWQVDICHIYRPFYSGFQSDALNEIDKHVAASNAHSDMEKFISQLHRFHPNVNIQSRCVVGSVVEEICSQATNSEAVLIVMGTLGATGLKSALIGSTTFDVVQEANLPVIAVPQNLRNLRLNKVGFTTNFHAVEITALHDFITLMEQPIEIIPFHLYQVDKPAAEIKMRSWKSKVDKMIADKPSQYKLVRMRHHTAGIRNFIRKEKLDALVMTRIQKGFFDRFIGRNLIKAVAHQCTIPVLFIPES